MKGEQLSFNLQQALLYHDDNHEFLVETLQLFLAEHAMTADKVRQLLADRDEDAACLMVHALKNDAALICSDSLVAACAEVERLLRDGDAVSEGHFAQLVHKLERTLEDVNRCLDDQ